MTSKPAYSPCEPAFGCSDIAAKPVIPPAFFELFEQRPVTARCRAGANGCMLPNSGQVTGNISALALSFIVQEPSGIMVR